MIFGANTLFFGTILFFFIFADNVFVNGKRSDKFAMYGMKPHSRVRDFFSKCFGGGLKVKEWPHDYNCNAPTMDEIIEFMERVDRLTEEWTQTRALKKTDLLLLAPTEAMDNQDLAYSTLNPVLYNLGTYNVVFKIGDNYPKDKPYLSIYLTSCTKKPKKKNILHLHTVLVQKNFRGKVKLTDTSSSRGSWNNDYTSPVYSMQDNAWVFKWTLPDSSKLFPSENYCFLFDMTAFDPSTSRELALPGNHNFRNIRNIVPNSWKSSFLDYKMFRKIKVSPIFSINPAPALFTEAYFARHFGGRDLSRFMGGDMFCFRFFSVMFNNDRGKWSSAVFYDSVESRAQTVAKWFAKMIDATPQRWRGGLFGPNHREVYMNTGFSDLEDRRRANQRAVGLLYHPKGREALKQIGKSFLEVSEAYEDSLRPMGRWKDFIKNEIGYKIQSIWSYHVAGFQNARRQLAYWVSELKKLCEGSHPSRKLFDDITAQLNPEGKTRVRLPVTGEKVYVPDEIERNIMKAMTKLVKYEIRIVLWKMGSILLSRPGNWNRWGDTLFGFKSYDTARAAVTAAIVRLYGTKFVTMADNFEFSTSSQDDYMNIENDDEDDEEISKEIAEMQLKGPPVYDENF